MNRDISGMNSSNRYGATTQGIDVEDVDENDFAGDF